MDGMNLEILRQKLLAAARAVEPQAHVPFGFERRVMARLADPIAARAQDAWALWGRLLWRALAPCCAVMIIAAASVAVMESSPSRDLGRQLDEFLMAGLDSADPSP